MKMIRIDNIQRNKQLRALLLCQLFIMLCSCVPPYNDFDDKTRWLQRNFPNHAANIDKIHYDPKFKQAILSGQILMDMTLDEALVAGAISPFGPNPATKVYWCNDKIVESCAIACTDCRAMLVRKQEIHFFETGERGLQVVASGANHKWPAHLSYLPSSYTSARAILQNEFIVGMQFDDSQQVSLPAQSETRYFCGLENRGRSDIPCSSQCQRCRVEIQIPRVGENNPRTIELFFKQQVLDRISEREIR